MLPVAPPTSTTVLIPEKVVGPGHGRRLSAVEADHGLAEIGRFLGMLRQVFEHGHPPGLLKAGLPGFERIEDLLPAVPKRRAAERDQRRSRRAGRAGLERFAQRRQGETLRIPLGEDAEASERAHETMQRWRVCACRARQFGSAPRPCRQVIGDAEFSRSVNDR